MGFSTICSSITFTIFDYMCGGDRMNRTVASLILELKWKFISNLDRFFFFIGTNSSITFELFHPLMRFTGIQSNCTQLWGIAQDPFLYSSKSDIIVKQIKIVVVYFDSTFFFILLQVCFVICTSIQSWDVCAVWDCTNII